MPMKKEKVKKIKVTERELEALLVEDLSAIDPKLKFLGHQIETDSGFLDILAVDEEDDGLALIELKVKEDDGPLFQTIRYYDWVKSRAELISRSYREQARIDVKVDPLVVLVAPSFSENLQKVTRYIDAPIRLYEYSALKLPDGDKYIICKEIDYGEPYEQKELPSTEGHLNYVTDEKVRLVCSRALSILATNHIRVEPRKRFLNLVVGAEIIGRIRFGRDFFRVISYLGEESSYHYVYTQKNWDSFFRKEIKPFI